MSKVVSLRLADEQMERLRRMARERGQTPSRTGAMLIEEALRMAEFPLIEFRDSPLIRQAYMRGSRVTAWQLESLARAYDRDAERIAAHLNWPVETVRAGLAYAEAYPQEMETAIADNESYDFAKVQRLFPHAELFVVETEVGLGGEEVGVTRDVAPAAR